jgi:hypothetical protein
MSALMRLGAQQFNVMNDFAQIPIDQLTVTRELLQKIQRRPVKHSLLDLLNELFGLTVY